MHHTLQNRPCNCILTIVSIAVTLSTSTEPSCKPNYNTDYCKIVEDVHGGQHKGHVPLGLGTGVLQLSLTVFTLRECINKQQHIQSFDDFVIQSQKCWVEVHALQHANTNQPTNQTKTNEQTTKEKVPKTVNKSEESLPPEIIIRSIACMVSFLIEGKLSSDLLIATKHCVHIYI